MLVQEEQMFNYLNDFEASTLIQAVVCSREIYNKLFFRVDE